MNDWLRTVFAGRPWWMNALMVFSGYMAFVYLPWDFFVKPVALDEEVWLGIMFHGVWAKLGEPLHWVIYAFGCYGFYRMRSWMWPWAAFYMASVAIGMLIWNVFYGLGGFGGLVVGTISALPFAWLTQALWSAEPLFGVEKPPLSQRYGEWALVTGASSGIGAEFARALARDGVSCVLSARRADRLEALAGELEKTWRVETRVVAADLADPKGAERLAEAVSDLEIGILVNNAGVGGAGRFDATDSDVLRDLVQLNCVAPVVLTRRLVTPMIERGRGAVIITGSVSGRQPLPLHAVYSASKAFDLLLGEALYVELRDRGVDVLVLEPGATETEFHEVAGQLAHPGEPAPKVVEVALDALGEQASVVSGWFNWLRANVVQRLAPRRGAAYAAREVMRRQTPAERR